MKTCARRKRLPWKRVVLALLLGAVVNLGVAWWCVWRVGYTPMRPYSDASIDELLSTSGIGRAGYPVVESSPEVAGRWWFYTEGPGYSLLEAYELESRSPMRSTSYYASRVGWPMLSLREDRITRDEFFEPFKLGVEYLHNRPNSFAAGVAPATLPRWIVLRGVTTPVYELRSGISFSPEDEFAVRRIPVRPMPLGFAANTLFYATPFLLFFFGVPSLRGYVRRKRGLCSRCAYDRSGLSPTEACPECGDTPR